MATGIRQIWREVTLTYPSLPFYLSFSYPSHTFASQSSSSVRFLYTMHPKGNFLFAGYTRHTIPCFATTASHMGDICILRPYTYAFGTGCFAFFFFSRFILGYRYRGFGVWDLVCFAFLHCNAIVCFLFPFGCKKKKRLRWGVYQVYICWVIG